MKKVFLCIIVFLSALYLQAQSNKAGLIIPSPYEPDVLKAFADSLYSQGFLSQAEGEYKRLLFALPEEEVLQNQNAQTSLLALSNIYKKQNNLGGIVWLKENFYSQAQLPVKEKINFVQAEFLFKERNAGNFCNFSDSLLAERKDFSPDFKNLVDVSELLLKNDIGGLRAFTTGLAALNPDYQELNNLCKSYKLKSPGLALFLSSLLPGSGRWYTGSLGAFTSSFLTIGTFAAGTIYTGIKSEWKSWQPYVFGTCGLVLYIVELYGSYQSAKRYNNALYRVLCEETEKLYEKEY